MSNTLRCGVTSPPLVLSLILHHVSIFLLKHASLWTDSSDSLTYHRHSITAPSAVKLDLTRIKGHLLIYICIYGCFTSEWRHTRTRCRQREWAKNLFHTAPVRFCGVNTEWMCNKSFFYILQLERYPPVLFGLCLAAYLKINRFELSCFLRFVLRSDEHTRPWTS